MIAFNAATSDVVVELPAPSTALRSAGQADEGKKWGWVQVLDTGAPDVELALTVRPLESAAVCVPACACVVALLAETVE